MNKKTVFVLLGQSNAVGHALPMRDEDKIITPLKNVFGLRREKNQSFDTEKLEWSGYTSENMNLGETQDNTYSIANLLAYQWQREIDSGKNLPDLYIVHIAIGAQGITEKYMWYPKREKKLVPGVLGKADISLFPFTLHILSLLKDSLGDFDFLGIHWRGGEEDTSVDCEILRSTLYGLYVDMIDSFRSVTDKCIPFVFHLLRLFECLSHGEESEKRIESMEYINEVFKYLSVSYDNITLFDPKSLPMYNESISGNNIFESDLVHFTKEANESIARMILEEYKNEKI